MGGKKQNNPNPSGYSNATASILGIVSEGQIEGLVNGLKSIYFNETPLQNNDGSLNFQNVEYDWRSGTQWQSRIPGFADNSSSEVSVEVEVRNPIPVVKTIVNANLDIIRIRFGVVLQQSDDKGRVEGSAVFLKISIKEGTGAFNVRFDGEIRGYYPSLTEFQYNFPVNNYGGTITDFTVKVERLNPQDTDTQRYQKVLTWRSYTEITEVKLSYPNSALFGLRFKTKDFTSGVPQIGLELGGISIIKIPTNATVSPTRGLIYNGLWNGTFYTPNKAVVDPAWILYDLLTNTRYGLGKYIKASQINKWALYEISQYCNEYVSDGYGGTEHRFSCNVLLGGESKQDAYTVVQSLISVFRGFSYWADGAIALAADKPGSPVSQFTQADVEEGLFIYSYTGLKTIKTIALVPWLNPKDLYKRTIETVEDSEGVAKYGIRETEVSAFACTSRGQARRAGMAVLLTDRLEKKSVTFKARAYAAYIKPGDIIKIMDSSRTNIRYSGLIKASTINTITLDSTVNLGVESYVLSVILSDGTLANANVLNLPGTHQVLNTTGFPSIPPSESNWILSSTSVQPQLFRVVNRVPVSGTIEMMQEITAVEYNNSKYTSIESGFQFASLPTQKNAFSVVNVVRNIVLSYTTVDTLKLIIVWDYPLSYGRKDPNISNYLIELKNGDNGSWKNTQTTVNQYWEYTGIMQGTYYVRIASVDVFGNKSNWVVSNPISINQYNWVAMFRNPYTSGFATEF